MKYLILFIISLNLFSQNKEVQKPEKNYLSYSWAYYIKNHPASDLKPKEEIISKSKKKFQEAKKLKESKKLNQAIKEFEEILNEYADAEIYYEYGNTLSNVPRLEDSIEAYKISERLGYKKPELVQYNIACVYSRLNKINEAYKYLSLAIDRGYSAFKYIQKDPDMANLRKEPDFEEKITALIPKSIKYTKADFVGKLEVPTPRLPIQYTLCKNGTAILFSECEKGFQRGRWEYRNGYIVANWQEDCTELGIGEASYSNAVCASYKKYKFDGCRKISEEMINDRMILSQTEIYYLKGVLKPEYGMDGEYKLTKSKDPKACDLNFKPKTTKELD